MTRLSAPAAQRNRGPILEVLQRVLPARGRVLEIASGSGEHVVYFARALTGLVWQPSDPDPEARASIRAWIAQEKVTNVLAPIALDMMSARWPYLLDPFDAVVCINMIHIAPWEACLGLLYGCEQRLPPGGPLVLYGPFMRGGMHTAPSNAAFDASLRRQDPSWGVRDLDDVVREAALRGFVLEDVVEMPADNLTVVLRAAK
ncbi:MAG: class I SAM-dependent methyltransferase [Betaproteobacteria bacterium]|jgi:cyclopropane fatty-acyl-phospholipid synthase-like methyltransferase|nr:class I SAM-dependent methyltransferase [Betaproteobacteria bacterium]